MRFLLNLLWLGASVQLAAQAAPLQATRVQPIRCPRAESLLGPRVTASRADLQAVYVPDQDQSLVFSIVSQTLPTLAGVRSITGLIRIPGHGPALAPALELTLRVFSDSERQQGTQWLALVADDSTIGDSLPVVLRRQGTDGVRRVLQSATSPLTAAQTLALVRGERLSGTLGGTPFTITDPARTELRALVVVALCGSTPPW